MMRTCLAVILVSGGCWAIACAGSNPPATTPEGNAVNPSADSGTIQEMTDNQDSPNSVDGGPPP